MTYQRTSRHAGNALDVQDDWDNVHNQLLAIQKKSEVVSKSGDSSEQEADEVAKKVVSGESVEIHGAGGTINPKGSGGEAEVTPEFQEKLGNSKGNGQPLNDSTRVEMESKMNADFSEVKIHTGEEAHSMN